VYSLTGVVYLAQSLWHNI